jgi:ATP-binding cassette, subfamily C, bacterial LapB
MDGGAGAQQTAIEITSPHWRRVGSEGAGRFSAFHGCLSPLLSALRWSGTMRHLQSAMPPSHPIETLLELRTVLFRVGFNAMPSGSSLRKLNATDLPCLFVPRREPDDCWVVLSHTPKKRLHVFSGKHNAFRDVRPWWHEGDVYAVKPVDRAELTSSHQGWVRHAASQEAQSISKLFWFTFAINLLAMLLPIYVMSVYDKAVFAHSNMTLAFLLGGIVLAMTMEFTLREARARGLAYLGARMESLITASALQRVLHLPASAVEQASLSSQVARLRMFESVRDAFSGPLASTLLDLPFLMLFIIVVFAIGGSAGWIVVAFAAMMAALVMVLGPLIRLQSLQAAQANSERRKFLVELTEHLETIRNCRVEDIWLQRNHDLSVTQLKTQSALQRLNFTEQTAAHVLFLLAGTAIIFYGAVQVMGGGMTPGALVALMALVWRVLTPIQTVFLNYDRIGQTREVFRQVDQLMRMPVEYELDQYSLLPRKFGGNLATEGVVFRYPNRPEPTLRGVSLEINMGECVALAGGSGSGKSTLLKLFAGLYPIQAGAIYLDGLDLRQIDPRDLRHNLGFLEEKHHVFSGSLADNIRLSNSEASEERIHQTLIEFKVLAPEARLEEIDMPIARLASDSALRRFALARLFIKTVPIYLLDEPSLFLDADSDTALRQKIERMKGKATIVMATVQPAYMRLADRVILMQAGRIWAQGAPEATIPLLMQKPGQGPAKAVAAAPPPSRGQHERPLARQAERKR